MAKKSVNRKVGEISLVEGGMIALSKVSIEQGLMTLTPLGNGNFVSGGAKLAGALALDMTGRATNTKRFTSIPATAMLIDGFEDVVTAGKDKIMNKNNNNQRKEVGF